MKVHTKPSPVRRVIQAISEAHASHRQRHTPSGFGFAFADRIDYLDSRHWDEITRDASVLLRRDVLRVIEQHGPPNIRPRYALVFRDNKAVVALAAQVLEFSGDRLTKEGLPIYLRLLHSTVEHAIAFGCKRLSLGRTALEPKAALGAKPEPMYVWLRHRVQPVNWLLRGILGAVPHDEAPERNPSKAHADQKVQKVSF